MTTMWQPRSIPTSNEFLSVAYGGGIFVAGSITGIGNRVMTSPDGKTWMSRSTANLPDLEWTSIAFGEGLFVAVAMTTNGTTGADHSIVMTSPTGETWTRRTIPLRSPHTARFGLVTYGNGRFVATELEQESPRFMISEDGITWTIPTPTIPVPVSTNIRRVTFGGGVFVAIISSLGVGVGTNQVLTSPDGVNWTLRQSTLAKPWEYIAYGGNRFVAVAFSGSTSTDQVMTSPTGETWTPGTVTGGVDIIWRSVTYGDGLFVAVGESNLVMTSPDGITWTTASHGGGASRWTGVIYGEGRFVSAGLDPGGVMTYDYVAPSYEGGGGESSAGY